MAGEAVAQTCGRVLSAKGDKKETDKKESCNLRESNPGQFVGSELSYRWTKAAHDDALAS